MATITCKLVATKDFGIANNNCRIEELRDAKLKKSFRWDLKNKRGKFILCVSRFLKAFLTKSLGFRRTIFFVVAVCPLSKVYVAHVAKLCFCLLLQVLRMYPPVALYFGVAR